MNTTFPPVDPSVTAELVAALPPRLRKRLDSGIAKLAGRPVVRDGCTVRVALDDTTLLELHALDGTVRGADAIVCGCLLAPACLHRAAAASAAPIAAPADGDTDAPSPSEADAAVDADAPTADVPPRVPPAPGGGTTAAAAAARNPMTEPGTARTAHREPVDTDTATAAERTAAGALYDAAAAVLEAGTDGSGAVVQAALLRAAHTARLAGLARPAASAVSVVNALRAARGSDPAYRLTDLVSALRDTLAVAARVRSATGTELTAPVSYTHERLAAPVRALLRARPDGHRICGGRDLDRRRRRAPVLGVRRGPGRRREGDGRRGPSRTHRRRLPDAP